MLYFSKSIKIFVQFFGPFVLYSSEISSSVWPKNRHMLLEVNVVYVSRHNIIYQRNGAMKTSTNFQFVSLHIMFSKNV